MLQERKDLQKRFEDSLKKSINDIVDNETGLTFENAESIYNDLTSCGGITVTPPEEEFMLNFMTVNSSGGRTVKPGNIFFNLRKISTMAMIPEIGLSMVTFPIGNKIAKVFASLVLLAKMINVFTIKITKEQAIIITALWNNCNYKNEIPLDDGYSCTVELCKELEEAIISRKKYNTEIDSLAKIGCIDLIDGIVWLKESISFSYK